METKTVNQIPQFATITQAIEILHISRPTIYRKIKAREIPFTRCGKKVLIPAEFFQQLHDEALEKEEK
ncbi:MAG: helix-turn-helix domain-containing protein [Treponema sp.]|jgi:excisionase family DNA binding protein|nr:helix-turn-helix domain-containing protein [Treponema sp.]